MQQQSQIESNQNAMKDLQQKLLELQQASMIIILCPASMFSEDKMPD